MQILHRTVGSIQQYSRDIKESSAADRYRPGRCPLCQARCCLLAHGFYYRTLVQIDFDDWIPVRRYLCRLCRRTVSLLPDFALPYLLSAATTPSSRNHRAHSKTHRYRITHSGLRTVWFCTRTYSRILRPGLGTLLPQLSPSSSLLRRCFDKLDQEVKAWIQRAKLAA